MAQTTVKIRKCNQIVSHTKTLESLTELEHLPVYGVVSYRLAGKEYGLHRLNRLLSSSLKHCLLPIQKMVVLQPPPLAWQSFHASVRSVAALHYQQAAYHQMNAVQGLQQATPYVQQAHSLQSQSSYSPNGTIYQYNAGRPLFQRSQSLQAFHVGDAFLDCTSRFQRAPSAKRPLRVRMRALRLRIKRFLRSL